MIKILKTGMVPIAELDSFKKTIRAMGISMRIRYRGPRRFGPIGQSTCLKKDATHFSAYRI